MRHLLVALLLVGAGCGEKQPEVPAAIAKQDRASWRKLAKGMTPDKVRALLGEPLRVENEGEATCWHYQAGQPLERDASNPKRWVLSRGSLLFLPRGGSPKLTEWREP
jgi:hypothetical protein